MTRYIVSETAISVVINVVISLAFVLAQFHGEAHIPGSGPGGLIRDAVPQTCAITIMSVLVPTLLTRKRGRAGGLTTPAQPRAVRPANVVLRALLLAILATACGLAFTWLLFRNDPLGLTFRATLVFKALYGACVAVLVTPVAVYAALHDVARFG